MDIYEMINEIGREEIKDILDAVLFRHQELYPHCQLSLVSIDDMGDKKEQLDKMIALLQNMKE